MVKPKWLALLVGSLLVVAAFVWLGTWQLERAFETSTVPVDEESYETITPMGELIQPGESVTDATVTRPIAVSGWLVPGDFEIVAGMQQGADTGWWVVGRLAIADDGVTDYAAGSVSVTDVPGMPVALGWAATEDAAAVAAEEIDASIPAIAAAGGPSEHVGTLEAPQDPAVDTDAADPQQINAMAPGQLINTWQEPAVSYYQAWVLLQDSVALPDGLEPIEIVPIDQSLQIDALNIFYAIEWALFAIMAIYIWWRLVRDDYLAQQSHDPEAELADEIRRAKLLELAKARTASSTHPERN